MLISDLILTLARNLFINQLIYALDGFLLQASMNKNMDHKKQLDKFQYIYIYLCCFRR